MTGPGEQSDRLAAALAGRLAAALEAQVWVRNGYGHVLSGAAPAGGGRPAAPPAETSAAPQLRVPFHVDGLTGEAIIVEPPRPEPLTPRAAAILVEQVAQQVAAADSLPNRQELVNSVIYDLLRGRGDDLPGLRRAGLALGINLARPRLVILVDALDYIQAPGRTGEPSDARLHRRVQSTLNSLLSAFYRYSETAYAYLGDGELALLPAGMPPAHPGTAGPVGEPLGSQATWQDLAALRPLAESLLVRMQQDTGTGITIALGRHHPGAGGLARSYAEARAALTLGRRFYGPNAVYTLADLGPAAFIGAVDEATKIALARHLLGSLLGMPELMATLTAFFAQEGSLLATAEALAIHRNTLSKRLDKVTSLTGLDPRQTTGAVMLRLALLLHALPDPPSPSSFGILEEPR